MDLLLKTKPEPSKQKDVTITIGILDCTSSNFNRDEFLKDLRKANPDEPEKPVSKQPDEPIKPASKKNKKSKKAGPVEGGPAEGGPVEGGPAEGGPAEGGPAEGGPAEGGPKNKRSKGSKTSDSELVKSTIVQKVPPKWYMNNRIKFIEFIAQRFKDYKEEIKEDANKITCSSLANDDFKLLTHQTIVTNYLNLVSPYRGLLLYHGLGSGKTCSSIAIAEGLKTDKIVVVLTPANIEKNYKQELKKCGDPLYKLNKHWIKKKYSAEVAKKFLLPAEFDAVAAKQDGIWLEDPEQPEKNYNELSTQSKKQIDAQVDFFIDMKYKFLHYNGSFDISEDMFNDKVVVVDEAHNLVSMIKNKLGTDEAKIRLYKALMSAKNCRIVLLTGTPILNSPNEIAVMFNIIRGFIKTWTLPLTFDTEPDSKINSNYFYDLFFQDKGVGGLIDYIDYDSRLKKLSITKNPPGFKNVPPNRMVAYDETAVQESDDDFIAGVQEILTSNRIKTDIGAPDNFKALPDDLEEFETMFIDKKKLEILEPQKLQRRILGLTSFFPDLTRLMPKYNDVMDETYVDMSTYQLAEYLKVREEEIEKESKKRPKKTDDFKSNFSYYSRAACNFVFPEGIQKPAKPKKNKNPKKSDEGEDEDDDEQPKKDDEPDATVEDQIKTAFKMLFEGDYLQANGALKDYSPKFLSIFNRINKEKGLHLLYSNYREVEGIGLLRLTLLKNGFHEFKLKKTRGEWTVDDEKFVGERFKCFVVFEGDDDEEKEIIRNIYNSDWSGLPEKIRTFVKKIHKNNYYGEVIKVFMITPNGSEGISLKNVQFVHLTEPHWQLVRLQQVIGRARRICSHQSLPEDKQKVRVFLYMMKFNKSQQNDHLTQTIRLKDKSMRDETVTFTTDQKIYEIAVNKSIINNKLLETIKDTAIDCSLYRRSDQCFSMVRSNNYSYVPDVKLEQTEEDSKLNSTRSMQSVTKRGKLYGYIFVGERFPTYVYTLADVTSAIVGQMVLKDGKPKFVEGRMNAAKMFEASTK